MADASVVIVNFNAGSFLRESVASALQCPDVSSVVIVDNASEDSSLDLPRPAISGLHAQARIAFCCSIPTAASRPERLCG